MSTPELNSILATGILHYCLKTTMLVHDHRRATGTGHRFMEKEQLFNEGTVRRNAGLLVAFLAGSGIAKMEGLLCLSTQAWCFIHMACNHEAPYKQVCISGHASRLTVKWVMHPSSELNIPRATPRRVHISARVKSFEL